MSANFFYTLSTLGNSRPFSSRGGITSIDGVSGYIGDASFQAAVNLYNTAVSSSYAVSAYNAAFGLNLSAIPVENGLGFGSIAAHWEEGYYGGTVGTDNRSYYGNNAPGAPGMNDELMTPISEGVIDMPCSRITLGSLKDLGYTVDFSRADTYEPLKYNIFYSNSAGPLRVGFYGNSYSVSARDIILKRGLTYYFVMSSAGLSAQPIYVVNVSGAGARNNRISQGVTNDGTGTGTLTWIISTSFPSATAVYLQSLSSANVVARMLVY